MLNQVTKDKRIIFVASRNTSSHEVNLENKIAQALKLKGYIIIDDPDEATCILTTNALYCDRKSENNTAQAAIGLGWVSASQVR